MTADKTVAILQPNYIPWKGYFDMIRSVDEFIFLDNVQYTQKDWRNRNLVKTAQGTRWITVPVLDGSGRKLINEMNVDGTGWRKKHWTILVHCYSKALYFDSYRQQFENLYLENKEMNLANIIIHLIQEINKILGIKTKLIRSSDYPSNGIKSKRLLDLCKARSATRYVSGPAAKAYLDESLFHAENIDVEWFDYSGYPEYRQLFPPFEHKVTILDLLFNEGPNAINFMKILPPR